MLVEMQLHGIRRERQKAPSSDECRKFVLIISIVSSRHVFAQTLQLGHVDVRGDHGVEGRKGRGAKGPKDKGTKGPLKDQGTGEKIGGKLAGDR